MSDFTHWLARSFTVLAVVAGCIAIPSLAIAQAATAQSQSDSADILEAKARFDAEGIELSRTAFAQNLRPKSEDWLRLAEKHFGNQFGKFDPALLGPAELDAIYSLNRFLINKTQQRESALRLITLTHEIERRRAASVKESTAYHGRYGAQKTYDAMINNRLFDLARQVAADFAPEVEPFPFPIVGASEEIASRPAVLVTEVADGQVVLRPQAVPLENGKWLVAFVRDGCAFSKMAMDYIEADADRYSAILPDKYVWVISQLNTSHLTHISDWNRDSRLIDMQISYRDAAWPREMFPATTPLFYLVEDGEVVASVKGWTDDSVAEQLEAMLVESP